MQLKPLFAAAALAVASFSASALTQSLGALPAGTVAGVGDNFPTATSFFSDIFTFTTTAGTISGSVFSSGISDFTVTLLATPLTTVGFDTTPTSFSFSGLSAGVTYGLQFTGNTVTAGGFYGGSVTAVPEPETYALMLAGLGAMGFIAARRRRG